MTTSGLFLIFGGLLIAAVLVATLVVVARGGLGPADPPVSHRRAGVGPQEWPAPRAAVHQRLRPTRPARERSARARLVPIQ